MKDSALLLIFRLGVMCLMVSGAIAAPAPVTAQTISITNAELDTFDGSGLANGWQRWWEESANPNDGTLNYAYKPDWSPETNPALVRTGTASQHIGLTWNPWRAGIRQTINVPPGARLRVTAYGRVFASTPDFPNPSDGAVQARMQVGVDPNGGTEWWSGAVQWSGAGNPHDVWQPFSVDFTAGSTGKVTIFLSANFKGESRYHLDVWWDSVSIEALTAAPTATIAVAPAQPVATLPPAATQPPTAGAATVAPTTTPVPTTTTEPTATALPPTDAPAATPTLTTGGEVCVLLFEDLNLNGALDSGEPVVTGGTARAAGTTGEVLSLTTGGISTPSCFSNLAPGVYIVSAQTPVGYSPGGKASQTIQVEGGSKLSMTFASVKSPMATASATPIHIEPPEDPGADNSRTFFIFGAATLGVALILAALFAVGILLWRKK